MPICDNCELPIKTAGENTNQTKTLCTPCVELSEGTPSVQLSPLRYDDLELVLAWRSHPKIYAHFRQQTGPLKWDNHISWYESRNTNRYDFVIEFGGRKVGVVSLDADDEVGIVLGDFSAHGHGVATVTLRWLCSRFEQRTPLFATIQEGNDASKRLFERCGFQQRERNEEWLEYQYEP